MKKIVYIITILSMLIAFSSLKAQPCLDTTTYAGTATYYTFTGTGICGNYINTDSLFTTALSTNLYDSSRACGTCLLVTGPLGSVVVTVADICNSCPANSLDLSKVAFSQIENLSTGTTNVSWKKVACPVTGDIKYYFSVSSNLWYIDVKVLNHRYGLKTVEFADTTSSYTPMARQFYNSFLLTSGSAASSPFYFRVTDILNDVIVDTIPFSAGTEVPGNKQFPLCNPSSIHDYEMQKTVDFYPNPANDMLFTKGNYQLVEIYDISGKLLLQHGFGKSIELGSLNKGIYFIRFVTNNTVRSGKLIID